MLLFLATNILKIDRLFMFLKATVMHVLQYFHIYVKLNANDKSSQGKWHLQRKFNVIGS